jgi:hypothetical protein
MNELRQHVRDVEPTAVDNLWQTIPWRRNLMQARAEAQKLNRPLFLWVMNGHPFGCT